MVSEEDEVRAKLLEAGWKQGACIDAQEALLKNLDVHEYHKKMLESIKGCLLIVTLYDCGGEVVYADNDDKPIQQIKPAFHKPIFCDCEVVTDHNGQAYKPTV